jgi:hypothetical protein
MTRVFFGCTGPGRTNVTTINVPFNSTVAVVESLVQVGVLPGGAVTTANE